MNDVLKKLEGGDRRSIYPPPPGSARQHQNQDCQQVTSLVQDDGQGHLPQTELACPVHSVVAGRADGRPGDYSDGIPCHESRNGQGKTPGRQGVDQQVTATFSLPQRCFRRLEGKVSGDVQEHRHRCQVRDITCHKEDRQGNEPSGSHDLRPLSPLEEGGRP